MKYKNYNNVTERIQTTEDTYYFISNALFSFLADNFSYEEIVSNKDMTYTWGNHFLDTLNNGGGRNIKEFMFFKNMGEDKDYENTLRFYVDMKTGRVQDEIYLDFSTGVNHFSSYKLKRDGNLEYIGTVDSETGSYVHKGENIITKDPYEIESVSEIAIKYIEDLWTNL